MRKLDGHNGVDYSNTKNPVSKKQEAILEALRYYFDDCTIIAYNANDAYKMINEYEDRIEVSKDKIFIDGWLIRDYNGIDKSAPTFNELFDISEATYDDYSYDPTDMSTWDDDDWIDFELDH